MKDNISGPEDFFDDPEKFDEKGRLIQPEDDAEKIEAARESNYEIPKLTRKELQERRDKQSKDQGWKEWRVKKTVAEGPKAPRADEVP